jgi:hypothetical protein
MPEYLLDNRKAEAGERFAALAALYDSGTLRQFDACGITAGWHCWEVTFFSARPWSGPASRPIPVGGQP